MNGRLRRGWPIGGRRLFPQAGAAGCQFPGTQTAGGKGLRREGGKRGSRPLGSQAALLKEEIAVRQVGDPGQAVLCQYDGDARLFHCGDHIVQLYDGSGVQVAGGFVQHQQARAQHAGGGKGDALLLAARQAEDTAVHQPSQAEPPGTILHAAADLGRGHPHILAGEGQLGGGVHIKILGLGVLEHAAHQRHVFLDGGGACQQVAYAATAQHPAGEKRWSQAVEQTGEGGFSAAAFAAQQHALPCPDGQGHVLQSRGLASLVGKADGTGLNQRGVGIIFCHHSTPPKKSNIGSVQSSE